MNGWRGQRADHPTRPRRRDSAVCRRSAVGQRNGTHPRWHPEPTPSPEFARSADDLYLHPLGFDDGATDSMVCDMSGTDPCSAPLQVLTTPELIQQGPSSLTAASDVVLAVENDFNANPGAFSAEHPLTLFGYSQSATAESIAMTRLAEAGIPISDLRFVFIGDPSTPGGVWPNVEADLDAMFGPSTTNSLLNLIGAEGVLGNVTPDDRYPTTIYTLDNDGVADFQQDFNAGGLGEPLVRLLTTHVEYVGLTPAQIAEATTLTDGDLTYLNISDDINNFDAWINAVFSGAPPTADYSRAFSTPSNCILTTHSDLSRGRTAQRCWPAEDETCSHRPTPTGANTPRDVCRFRKSWGRICTARATPLTAATLLTSCDAGLPGDYPPSAITPGFSA